MVTRYRFNYVQEMFETDTGEQHNETERGEWVKYEDYAALELRVLAAINHLEDAREWSDPESVDAGVLLAIGALRGRE